MRKPSREPDYIYDYNSRGRKEHFWIKERIFGSYLHEELVEIGKWRYGSFHSLCDTLEWCTVGTYWQQFETDNEIMLNRIKVIAEDLRISKALEDALWAK